MSLWEVFVLYQALYRKWRPKTFDDVVGQRHITETLKGQVSSGRLSHAYLFIGTRGTGKTTCAKILSKAVNCEHPVNGGPCNQCSACLGIDDGSVMDVVEMDAASNNGVDNVRALRDEAIFSPAMVKKRVYIVDEVHMLSSSAFNALLKILEEPPEHLIFILATTELHKVPATILSRCQRHSFKRLDIESITARLQYVAQQEHLELSAAAAELIARLSEGGMRDALSLLDQCSGRQRIGVDEVYSAMGLAGRQSTAQLLRHIADRNTAAALDLFAQLWQDGKDPSTLLGELSSLQRDVLMEKVAPKGGAELLSSGYDEATIAGFASRFSAGALINNINVIQDTLGSMRAGQTRVLCELCIVSLCNPELGAGLPALRERVARLESATAGGPPPPSPTQVQPSPTIRAPAGEPAYPEPSSEPSQTPAPQPVSVKSIYAPPDDRDAPPEAEDYPPFDCDPPPPPCTAPFTGTAQAPDSCITDFPPASPAVFSPSATSSESISEWSEILPALKGAVSIGIYAMLSDSTQTVGLIDSDTLTLYIEPGFTMNNINRPDILSRIAQAAGGALGRSVQVRVTARSEMPSQATADGTTQEGLDNLGKFDIVSFK